MSDSSTKPKMWVRPAILLAIVVFATAVFFLRRGPDDSSDNEEPSFDAFSSDAGSHDDASAATPGEGQTSSGSERGGSPAGNAAPGASDVLNRPGPDDAQKKPTRGSGESPSLRRASGEEATQKEEIQAAVEAFRPVVRRCYESLLDEFPDASGKVTLDFTILGVGDEGRVEMSRLGEDTTLWDERLHDCLLEKVGDVEFPAPEDGGRTRVTYPFHFQAE